VLSVRIESASPHDVTLVEKTLDNRFVEELPEKRIGDKANDSDPLDERLKQKGIEFIASHRAGRKLRRYKRRWKFERFFVRLFNYRKCVVRYE